MAGGSGLRWPRCWCGSMTHVRKSRLCQAHASRPIERLATLLEEAQEGGAQTVIATTMQRFSRKRRGSGSERQANTYGEYMASR
jgi:hypothetical protein